MMRDITELTEAQLELVSGGVITSPSPPPGSHHGAILVGGRPPSLIFTPSGQVIEPGTGPVTLVPKS
jgi:hypothetical protein